MKLVANIFYLVALAIIMVIILAGCNTRHEGTSAGDASTETGLNLPDAEQDSDIPFLDTEEPDAGQETDAGCDEECQAELEYRALCWRHFLYYCTPDGRTPGDDPTLYQQQMVFDVCDENGVPCDPSPPNDPNPTCVWELVDQGECLDFLECDPNATNNIVELDVPCEGIDENGETYSGFQDFYCHKGQIKAGPCDPCEEEICDGIDNDCDDLIDEGEYPCETECGPGVSACIDGELSLCDAPVPEEEICNYQDDDCDGETDEGQTNACGICGDIPEDICNGIDDDCNGTIDTSAFDNNGDGILDPLLQPCNTLCGNGYEQCYNGQWSACSAQQPLPEQCNGEDDDCDGQIDEGLECACPVEMADNPLTPENEGILIPCMEEPLSCGQGWKTCECEDPDCLDTIMTPCKPLCVYMPQLFPPDQICDEELGEAIPEICNNFDDDCDQQIDEELIAGCYTGPQETINVGICHGGQIICVEGQWGNHPDIENQPDLFVGGFCLDEQTPLEEDLCNDADDNCDGIIEEIMEPTDILFILDGSGSMSDEIEAVVSALSMFAANYSDTETIQWGLVIGPSEVGGPGEKLYIAQNLTEFNIFIGVLAALDGSDLTGGKEMLYDAVYLSIQNLIDPLNLPIQIADLAWSGVADSLPPAQQFNINWRPEAHHVVIVFSDEEGQTYMQPDITQQHIIDAASHAEDLAIYTFSPNNFENSQDWNGTETGWGPISVGGSFFTLNNQAPLMFDNLMQILDETACQ